MQQFRLPANQMFTCTFSDTSCNEPQGVGEIQLCIVLSGQTRLRIKEKSFLLSADDIALIDTQTPFSMETADKSLRGTVFLQRKAVQELLGKGECAFRSGVLEIAENAIVSLRTALGTLLQERTDKYASAAGAAAYYSVINILCEHLAYSVLPDQRMQRSDEIRHLIGQNYASAYTLGELASALHLSETYLARYIRQNMGTSFHRYLTSVRLMHAREQLLRTDNSLTRIALDNGFPSAYAFNKAFMEAWETSPAEDRRRNGFFASVSHREEALSAKARSLMQDSAGHHKAEGKIYYLNADVHHAVPLQKCWTETLNIGVAKDLLRYDVRAQVVRLKKELRFTHLRFWDLFDPELLLVSGQQRSEGNFTLLDKVLDFLTANGLAAHLDLGFKPILLLRSSEHSVVSRTRDIAFSNPDEYGAFLRTLLRHCVERYGMETVSDWRFEQWNDPRFGLINGRDDFFLWFEAAESAIHGICPYAEVGGGSFAPDALGDELHRCLLRWAQRLVRPDFVSVYAYPYNTTAPEKKDAMAGRVFDGDFLGKQASRARQCLINVGWGDIKLYVTEWNISVSNRNTINDSCFKGAFLVKSLIHARDEAQLIAYWLGSDFFGEHFDTACILSGGAGLLSRDDIAKPAMSALQFMNMMSDYVIAQSEHCLITSSGQDEIQILCHNSKALNMRYFTTPEDQIDINAQEKYFSDTEMLELHLCVENLTDGIYLEKCHIVNAKYGSVQDEWRRMGLEQELSSKDIEYLARISTPHIWIRRHLVENGCLSIDLSLEPNEFRILRLSPVTGRTDRNEIR